ncbi:hypothetical protein ABZY03_22490 [Streptomyces klenkii]|uniref:hypothetical protein n=1 Tax=Streptomyces klenkii TaxID=1420899 RepID=UPI0033BCF3CC
MSERRNNWFSGDAETVIQAEQVSGTIGESVVINSDGPGHLGTGDQIIGSVVIDGEGAGDGAVVIEGDVHGGIHRSF